MSDKMKKRKMRKVVKTIWSLFAVIIVGVGIYAGYLYYKADAAIQRISSSVKTLPAFQPTPADEMTAPIPDPGIKPMMIMLAGIDSREGADGMMNTDVLMLVSYNPDTRSASLLSIPRDLLIKSESSRSRKANYYYAHYYIKDKSEAIPTTKQFFSELFDLPIDYMVVVDFNALRKTVDALGGLQIDVEMDMKYKDSADGTNIDLRKGLQTLDGQHVLDYVRYRKSNQGTRESSDFARNERQQQVIKQILDKLGAFNGISQWGTILDIIGENVTSDIPESVLRQWILNFPKLKPNQMESLQMESVWKSPFVYVKQDDLADALAALRKEAGLSTDSNPKFESIGTMNK